MSNSEKSHHTFAKRSIDLLYESNKELLNTMSVFGCAEKRIKLNDGNYKINSSKKAMSPQKVHAIKFFIKHRCKQKDEFYNDKDVNKSIASALQVIQRREKVKNKK